MLIWDITVNTVKPHIKTPKVADKNLNEGLLLAGTGLSGLLFYNLNNFRDEMINK